MINTFDDKTEVTYDIVELGKHFERCLKHQEQIKQIEIAKLESYYRGYCEAIYNVAETMKYTNYRAKAKETEKVGD